MSASSIESASSLEAESQVFSISEKGLRVVRGTPQVERGGGGSDSIAPSAYIPILTVLRMGPVIAAGGTRNLINGDPQNPMPQWDPNLPKGTRIS